ncbi:hypothetical protein QBC42DRAFT_218862 [Cladorrhinum samala]|uniref:SMP-30/Gluconolactonase/LRE-like region domain-containing protein n=1 Tax=Cladorrhinum samala TaxID=585594 RepID=A0AAV9HYX6_9PEZI|nr:hypothetical protein QBC42DRAFT_218862 [Cladorrhinum samala]
MHNLTLLIVSLLPLLSLAAPFPCKQAKLTELYSFTPSNPLFVENILTLPDNRLLLTTFSPTGDLFVLDPNSQTPKPITVTSFPNTTVQLGIAPLGNHRYAVATGILGDLVFVYGTGNIRIISLPPQSNTARQLDVIPVPDTYILNGMISLPKRPHVLLSADSTGGRILRTDTRTKRTTTVLSDPGLLGPGNNTVLPLGVNGIKIRGGHLYFTNSALGLFGRVRINEDGTRFGSEIEVLSRLRGEIGYANAFDDFAIDERTGDAYVTWHDRSLVRISRKRGEGDGKGWKQEVVLKAPTAVAFGNSGKELYVTTAGQVNGTRIGGQVVKVDLC